MHGLTQWWDELGLGDSEVDPMSLAKCTDLLGWQFRSYPVWVRRHVLFVVCGGSHPKESSYQFRHYLEATLMHTNHHNLCINYIVHIKFSKNFTILLDVILLNIATMLYFIYTLIIWINAGFDSPNFVPLSSFVIHPLLDWIWFSQSFLVNLP